MSQSAATFATVSRDICHSRLRRLSQLAATFRVGQRITRGCVHPSVRWSMGLWVHHAFTKNSFLDASSHLYKRLCPSVRPSVGRLVGWSVGPPFLDASSHLYKRCFRPSVGPSVGPSVRPSVRNAFVKIAENGVMQDEGASRAVYPALFLFRLSHL